MERNCQNYMSNSLLRSLSMGFSLRMGIEKKMKIPSRKCSGLAIERRFRDLRFRRFRVLYLVTDGHTYEVYSYI
jgi:hypothetical protein